MSDRWNPYRIGSLAADLSERDLAVLQDIERFRLLDARLVQRRQFRVGIGGHRSVSAATRATNRVLARLCERGFISPLMRKVGGAHRGSTSTVWQLAATGERFLRALRGEPKRRRFVEPTYGFLEHTLAVASFATDLELHAADTGLEVLELEVEPLCWRAYSDPHGGTATLKPDLYSQVADEHAQLHSFIEVDRGTEHMPAILRKCHSYERYRRSGMEQAASGVFPAVLWVTTTAKRAAQIDTAIANDPDLTTALFRATTNDAAVAMAAPPTT